MPDHHPGYVPAASDGYTSNHPSNTGELDDSPGYYRLQWGTSTTFRPFFDDEVASADQRMGDLPHTELPDEVSQHHGDFAGRSDAQNYGHLDANMSWTPSVAEDSREGARADSERPQWTSPSTHASLGELDIFNNDEGAEYFDENDDVSGTYASDYVDSAELFAPQPLFTTEHAVPPEGSGNVFSHGVLSRDHGHHEALGSYTTLLLHRIEPLEHGFRRDGEAATDNPTGPDRDSWTMQPHEMAGEPQPWQLIGGQQQMEFPGVGPMNDFQCEVREYTPVVQHPRDFESESM